jgi:phytoene synthase
VSDGVVASSREAIRKGSHSFAAAARLFDPRTRDDASMLYAWCRHCDDVIDGQTLGHGQVADFRAGQEERLERLRAATLRALRGAPGEDPVFAAFTRVVGRNEIPARLPLALLDGFAMDVRGRRYETLGDTLDYAYHVAGVVGVMMAMIMGVRDEAVLDRACDLGLALQLTNIARDVIEDAEAGRVYLPAELLGRCGVEAEPEAVRDPALRPQVHDAARLLLEAAEPYYLSAQAGLAALPLRCAWAIAAARAVYRDIGVRLLRLGSTAWDSRVSVPRARKLTLVGLAAGSALASRLPERPAPREGLWTRPTRDLA